MSTWTTWTFTRGLHLTLQNLDASYKNINNRHARAQEFTQDSTPPASVRQFLVFRACALCRCKCLSIPRPLPAHHILFTPAHLCLSIICYMDVCTSSYTPQMFCRLPTCLPTPVFTLTKNYNYTPHTHTHTDDKKQIQEGWGRWIWN